MARTVLNVIETVSRKTGLGFFDGAFESSGNTTTTGVDNTLKNEPTNKFTGKHIYIDGGSPTERNLVARLFTQSSGTLTWNLALGAAPDSLAFMILPFSKPIIEDAIQRAALILHDRGLLIQPARSTGFVSGSPLYNAGWDYWTSTTAVDGWPATTVTLAQNTTDASDIPVALDIVGAGSPGYVEYAGRYASFLDDFRGETLNFYANVKFATASEVRLSILEDSTVTNGAYHGGTGWEVIKVEKTGLDKTADIKLRINNDGSNTCTVGRVWVSGGAAIKYYPFPPNIFTQINKFSLATASADTSNVTPARQLGNLMDLIYTDMTYRETQDLGGDEIGQLFVPAGPLGRHIPNGRIMVLEGSGPLTIPSTDTGNISIDRTEEQLLAAQAALILLNERSIAGDERMRNNFFGRIQQLQQEIETLADGYARSRALPPTLQFVR